MVQEIVLRPYQKTAVEEVRKGFASHVSGLLVLPTASGKTTIAAELFKRYTTKNPTHKCIFVVHRIELYNQSVSRFNSMGIKTTGWSADSKDSSGSLIVVMKDSARGLAEAIKNRVCGLYLVDEAHHDAADSYVNLRQDLQPKFRLGLTATPTRLDGKDLEFGVIFYQKKYLELMKEGWLSRPTYIRIRTGENKLFHIDRNEISSKDLADLNNDKRNNLVSEMFVNDKDKWGKTLAFAVNVDHAKSLKAGILKLDPTIRAEVLYGDLHSDERADIISRYAAGEIDILLNVAIAIEGFDDPMIKTVFLCRPTTSETYFMQMIGRGARLKDKQGSRKNKFNIVSFIDGETMMARLMDCWAYEHLGAEIPLADKEEIERSLSEQKKLDDVKSYKKFLKTVGTTRPLETVQSEVYDILGAYVFTNRSSTKRYVVDAKKKLLLEEYINYCRLCFSKNTTIDYACDTFIPTHGHKHSMNRFIWISIASAVRASVNGYDKGFERPAVEFIPFILEDDDVLP